MSRSLQYICIYLAVFVQACSGSIYDDPPTTVIQIGIQKVEHGAEIDEEARYMTEIELSQSIAMVFPRLRGKCSPRLIFLYDRQNLRDISFPTMTIFAYGKDIFVESYDRDEERLKRVASKIAELGNAKLNAIMELKSSIVTRVKIRKRMTYMQLLYILKRIGLNEYVISCQYICRDVRGSYVKRMYKHWMRIEEEKK